MIRVQRTDVFIAWFRRLRDEEARARIALRINRLAQGNAGDVRPVGSGISELRVPYGPGYRLYCAWRGETLVILLCGGDKATQHKDIDAAKQLLKDMERS